MKILELEHSSLLNNAMKLRDLYGWAIIGEPFDDAPGQSDGIYLDQIPEAAQIYIIATDQSWAESLRRKVRDSRSNSHVEVLTMEYANKVFRYGGIRGSDSDKLTLPTWDGPVSTGFPYDGKCGVRAEPEVFLGQDSLLDQLNIKSSASRQSAAREKSNLSNGRLFSLVTSETVQFTVAFERLTVHRMLAVVLLRQRASSLLPAYLRSNVLL